MFFDQEGGAPAEGGGAAPHGAKRKKVLCHDGQGGIALRSVAAKLPVADGSGTAEPIPALAEEADGCCCATLFHTEVFAPHTESVRGAVVQAVAGNGCPQHPSRPSLHSRQTPQKFR